MLPDAPPIAESERHEFDGPQWADPKTGLKLCRRIVGRGFCLKPASDPVHAPAPESPTRFRGYDHLKSPEERG